MKEIILSCDGASSVYLVPDEVADNLEKYCIEFCTEWLWKSPDAKYFRTQEGVSYDQEDFIEYLNDYIFPNQKSTFVKNLGWSKLLSWKYRKLPYFNF